MSSAFLSRLRRRLPPCRVLAASGTRCVGAVAFSVARAVLVVCQFFFQGCCRFRERCWNEHPRGGGVVRQRSPAPHGPGSGKGGGGPSTSSQRHTNVIPQSTFTSNAWGGNGDHGRGFFGSSDPGSSSGGGGGGIRMANFSQNRFSELFNGQNIAGGCNDEEERLLESVMRVLEIWESSGQWIYSSYSAMKGEPNVPGFADISPEELRLEYYNCRANNDLRNFINSVQELAKQQKKRLLELKASNASTKAASLSELKNVATQPLNAFGFGGQQTSSSSRPSSSHTPLNELTPEELKQFKAKAFEPGKIPLRPPPIELIYF